MAPRRIKPAVQLVAIMDCPLDWRYSGPAPPSPFVVSTVPAYFGGRPTPPSSPLKARVTVDDYAPCPPTPHCVPAHDELESPLSPDSTISQSTLSETDPDDPTSPEVPDDDQCDYWEYHTLDCLLYSHEVYGYPSPVMAMMQRANLDRCGLETQPLNIYDCGQPLKHFTPPKTGMDVLDQQSLAYYDKSPLREPECFLPHRYPVRSIVALQYSIYVKWSSVYPTPIPPIIVRSRDLVGPRSLDSRREGFAFVVPTEDSIWNIVRRRGIDWDYRPIDPSLEVDLDFVRMGDASYYPQHIVASRFAVNIFLEVADSATGPAPLCEYLGAYVLQTLGPAVIARNEWMNVDLKVQLDVFTRAPNWFQIYRHPVFGWPHLPCVRFNYYKWDRNMVGLADEITSSW